MKNNTMKSRGFTLVELLVVIAIIATLAGIATPMILNSQKSGARTQAVSNAKQIGLALIQFDTDYGSFPDAGTASQVTDLTGKTVPTTIGTSNDAFKQLIATTVQSEEIFFSKQEGVSKPDNVFDDDTSTLDSGECGFGYIMLEGESGDEVGQSSAGNAGRPVVITPLLVGGTGWECDPDPFGNKAVVLRLDNSVTTPTIKDDNTVAASDSSKTIDETGSDTVWGSRKPVLKRPDFN